MAKTKTSLYMSDDGHKFWRALAKFYGLSMSQVLEQTIREECRAIGLIDIHNKLLVDIGDGNDDEDSNE